MILNIFLVKCPKKCKSFQFEQNDIHLSIVIYHYRKGLLPLYPSLHDTYVKMNRSGFQLARILTNCHLKNVTSISSNINQYKSYHFATSKPELLKFTPTSISCESNRRTLFSSKEPETAAKDEKKEEGEEVSENEKALQEQVATLSEKNEDLLDKYRRSLADFENLRNRMNKQVSDAKLFGIQGFCKVCTNK